MIQSPQLNFAPQKLMQHGYQPNAPVPVQQQNMPMPGAVYNYPAAPAVLMPDVKYNGVNIGIKNPQGNNTAGGYGSYGMNSGYTGYLGNGYGSAGMMPAVQPYGMMPQNQGQFNGVNIEIVNPQGMGQPQGMQMPPAQMMPAPFYPQQPLYPASAQMMPQMTPQMTQLPPMLQAQGMNAPFIQPVQEFSAPAGQISAALPAPKPETPVVPEPVIKQAEPAPPPIIDTPVEPVPSVNPEIYAGRLRTHDMDEQKAVIEEVADKVKNSETDGPVLLDTQIFDALVDIINRDTSSLAGPSPEVMELRQKDPADLTPSEKEKIAPTPLEKAEINKQYALYTISYMQERLNKELEKRKGSALEMKDLPCIDTVIDTAKGNQNPILRQGAIAALSHIARPEYSRYLSKIFELAGSDEDERVRDAAAKAAKNLQA